MILFGYLSKEYAVAVGTRYCGACQRETLMLKKAKKFVFTLFFVPVIPLGYRKKDTCLSCGNKYSSKKFSQDLTAEFIADQLPEGF